jgi:hypothetical protein
MRVFYCIFLSPPPSPRRRWEFLTGDGCGGNIFSARKSITPDVDSTFPNYLNKILANTNASRLHLVKESIPNYGPGVLERARMIYLGLCHRFRTCFVIFLNTLFRVFCRLSPFILICPYNVIYVAVLPGSNSICVSRVTYET